MSKLHILVTGFASRSSALDTGIHASMMVLLKSEGWINVMIGQALRIYVDTVGQDWQREQKLKLENSGSQSKLNKQQSQQVEWDTLAAGFPATEQFVEL